jgi:very-short-patch-repair endonuclease
MTPAAHPLLLSLFAPVGDASAVADTGFPKDEVDERLTARDLHHVRDADPSQIAVIEDIKAGRSMVVEGPPGTGKSQTITNAIAELLAMDKSVLFVSEKMAALEVVKARLDEAGLGDFCLELHSNKTNKREVLKEIERVSKLPPPAPESLEREYDRHTALRDELNSYACALREPIGAARLSPWLLYSMRETAIEQICCTHAAVPADVASGSDTADAADTASVAETEFGMPQYVTITNPQDCTAEQISAAEAALGNVEAMLRTIGPPAEHPWLGCAPTLVTPTDEPEVARLLDACRDALQVLCTSLEAMTEAASVVKSGSAASEVGRGDAGGAADAAVMANGALLTRAATPARARSAIDAAELIARAPCVDRALLADPRWDAFPDDAAMLIAEATKYAELKGRALARMRATALDADAQPLATKFRDASASFFRFLNPSYHRLKKTILALYTARERRSDADLLADVTLLADAVSTRKRIEARSALGKELFGGAWRGCESDALELKRLGDWLVAFRRHLTAGDFQAVIEDAIANASAISATAIATAAVGARAAYARFAAARDALFARVKPDCARVFGADCDETPFDSLAGKLLQWRDAVGKLPRWSQYVEIARAASAELAKPVVELAEAGRVAPDMLNETFKLSLAESLLRYAFAERKVLALFESEVQESKIKRFGDLERMLIDKSRRLLAYELARKRPHLSGGVIPGSEMGILVTQINRKRRHLPLRKLFALCGGLIRRIKPCFMMSPLSIAQFIDPRTARFDVIIFDEASQVRPEDALGALLRGAQLVVMGDSMQLPPTSFFERNIDEEDFDPTSEDYLEDSLSGTESILDVAKTSFPSKTLSWHYRSRHESLIAVSNSEFYDNKLLIYPSPITNPQELGLSLSCHPDTVYDRGKSSTNRDEARIVVEAAIEHYKRHPEKSLGVGTFSMSQQQAIFDELDRAIKNDPEIEPYFNHQRFEHFFVKNLETIQGDERDVIFISVGYGKDKDGKLTLNFGPLNFEGGERRLNVLITRARERCVVFSNFRADAIALDAARDARLRGVRALKTFLKFAETRRLETIASVSTEVESEFEECVRRFLSENGYSVNPQVGCAGFRVDLGIVDAESPGRYLAGVECDGWKYHSSPVARDRDRLRQQMLEQLGWTIVRVWSTDWYQSRRDCEKRLLDRLAAIKAGRASGAGKAPGLSSTVAGSSSPKEDQADIANAAGIEPSSADARNADTTNAYVSDLVTPYVKCTSFGVPKRRELLETDPRILADAVAAVVKVEWPVHYTEVMRRIRAHWGVARLGARIEEHLRRAMAYAVRAGMVAAKGDYLFVSEYLSASSAANPVTPESNAASKPQVTVRRRDDDPKPDVAIISDDEIAAAVVIVIRAQYSIFPDALAKESAYLFGFKAVSEETAAYIRKVIDEMVARGALVLQPNGMIGLGE